MKYEISIELLNSVLNVICKSRNSGLNYHELDVLVGHLRNLPDVDGLSKEKTIKKDAPSEALKS